MDEQQKNQSSVGSLIGLLIIIALMVVGGIYFLNQRNTDSSLGETQNATTTTERIPEFSTSTIN